MSITYKKEIGYGYTCVTCGKIRGFNQGCDHTFEMSENFNITIEKKDREINLLKLKIEQLQTKLKEAGIE